MKTTEELITEFVEELYYWQNRYPGGMPELGPSERTILQGYINKCYTLRPELFTIKEAYDRAHEKLEGSGSSSAIYEGSLGYILEFFDVNKEEQCRLNFDLRHDLPDHTLITQPEELFISFHIRK